MSKSPAHALRLTAGKLMPTSARFRLKMSHTISDDPIPEKLVVNVGTAASPELLRLESPMRSIKLSMLLRGH